MEESALEAARAGARREALEDAAVCAEAQTGGFSACLGDVDEEGREFAVRDEDGPWIIRSQTARAIRALAARDTGGESDG